MRSRQKCFLLLSHFPHLTSLRGFFTSLEAFRNCLLYKWSSKPTIINEYGTNLKIRFFGNFKKKNEQYKKRIVRFSLQFLKPKRLLSRPRLIYSRISHYHYPLIMSLFLVSVKFFQRLIDGTNGKSHNTVIVAINCFDKRTSQALDTICACFISIITSC